MYDAHTRGYTYVGGTSSFASSVHGGSLDWPEYVLVPRQGMAGSWSSCISPIDKSLGMMGGSTLGR